MRISRVLLAGAAVATAAVTTSAFTASNTMPADSILGYGEIDVTGATVDAVAYNRDATDSSRLDNVVFTTSTDVTGQTTSLTLKTGTTFVSSHTCVVAGSVGTQTITCATGDVLFSAFNVVGLTVGQ